MLGACGFTRRAQAVTWKAWEDLGITDPACLQRLHFRVQDGKLNMNVHMRSNDAFKAAFMNMYAFVELQAWMAERLSLDVGDYCHIADSFHIYGSYFDEFEGFLKLVGQRSVEQRVWESAYAQPLFIEGCEALLAEPDVPEDKRGLLQRRLETLREACPTA
jgi:thymidylate synthase